MLGLEKDFAYEQCLLFRSLAEAEVVREATKRQAQASVNTAAAGGGWYSWLVGAAEVRGVAGARPRCLGVWGGIGS